MYETFDHTADLGLRISAPSLPELFSEAATALFSIMVVNLDAVQPVQTRQYTIEGAEPDYLLFDWLSELLYTFDSDGLLLREFHVELTDAGLTATAAGEPLDHARHQMDHEVKAITYHQLSVKQTAHGYQAEVIVDI